MPDQYLADKVVIVFGSTYGIGAETAKYLASLGASVVVTGRSVDKGEQVVADIHSARGQALFERTDIAVEADVQAAVAATVARYGGLDAIVNCAAPIDVLAAGGDAPITQLSNEGFGTMLQVAVWGLFWCCKHSLPAIIARSGGSVVNISSVAGVSGVPGSPTYAMTKGAMQSLTRSLAVDYGSDNVRANCLVLGTVPSSELVQYFAAHPLSGPAMRAGNALPRLGEMTDVAKAVAFLVSDDSAWITGAQLPVDGGHMIKSVLPDFSPVIADYMAMKTQSTAV
jgi:meso-butanediol dehydrogenase / (S,S)-butanediol dehydrogenase / diacetyl reductase